MILVVHEGRVYSVPSTVENLGIIQAYLSRQRRVLDKTKELKALGGSLDERCFEYRRWYNTVFKDDSDFASPELSKTVGDFEILLHQAGTLVGHGLTTCNVEMVIVCDF